MSKTWHRKRSWYDEDDNDSQNWHREKRRKKQMNTIRRQLKTDAYQDDSDDKRDDIGRNRQTRY